LKLFRINSIWTALRALLGWPVLMVGLYFMAAVVGSLIPVNGGWREPKDGITIYLHDNGIHTSIIIPCADVGARDNCLFPTEHLPNPNYPTRWQMIGWGDREFYLKTPTWGDLDLSVAITAFKGSGHTLVHVDHLERLPQNGIRAVRVSAAAFLRIVSDIMAETLVETDITRYAFKAIKGYGNHDVFYSGRRVKRANYSALYTCNNWISDLLAKAGVKTGYWTPLPFGVMWWYGNPVTVD
jgi:uncharacterized protein (TIGR02117 family)